MAGPHDDTPGGALDVPGILARARAAAGPDGRLPVGGLADWETFPFEREGLALRALEDLVVPEPVRHGDDPATCSRCTDPDDAFVWTDGTWRLWAPPAPSVPGFVLVSRAHVDLGDLDDAAAADLGRMVVRLERALAAVPGVGRVHVHRWGDGSGHLHLFVDGRPEGMLQLRGLVMPLWTLHLPPLPATEWRGIVDAVVAALESGTAGR